MRTVRRYVGGGALLVLLASAALPACGGDSGAPAPGGIQWTFGVINGLTGKNVLVGGQLFSLGSQTQITVGQGPGTVANLALGLPVVVSFEDTGSELLAHAIAVDPAASGPGDSQLPGQPAAPGPVGAP